MPRLAAFERSAVFISSPNRTCAVWKQRLAAPTDSIVWDYHVVLFVRRDGGNTIWDLDSRLPFPSPADRYLEESFPVGVRESLRPRFRVVGSEELNQHFASDRRHMRTAGKWKAAPPPWPPIVARSGAVHTLEAFVDVTLPGPGILMDLEAFRTFVGVSQTSKPV